MLAMIIPQVFLPVLREMIQSSKEFDCNKHSAPQDFTFPCSKFASHPFYGHLSGH